MALSFPVNSELLTDAAFKCGSALSSALPAGWIHGRPARKVDYANVVLLSHTSTASALHLTSEKCIELQ
jgi:hypothetical protein